MKRMVSITMALLLIGGLAVANGKKESTEAAPAQVQKVVIKWASVHPPAHPASQTMVRVAKEVMEKTNGRVEIKPFPGGQLGGSMDLIQGVHNGIVDMVSEGAA